MIQIRDVLQVKFGKIDQAVELFTQLSTPASDRVVMGQHFEVLTDITGEMYNLVNESVVESMAEFTETRQANAAHMQFGEREECDHHVATLRAQLGEADWAAAWQAGQALTMDQAIAYAREAPRRKIATR